MKIDHALVSMTLFMGFIATMVGIISTVHAINLKAMNRAEVECPEKFTMAYDVCKHRIVVEIKREWGINVM